MLLTFTLRSKGPRPVPARRAAQALRKPLSLSHNRYLSRISSHVVGSPGTHRVRRGHEARALTPHEAAPVGLKRRVQNRQLQPCLKAAPQPPKHWCPRAAHRLVPTAYWSAASGLEGRLHEARSEGSELWRHQVATFHINMLRHASSNPERYRLSSSVTGCAACLGGVRVLRLGLGLGLGVGLESGLGLRLESGFG